MLQEFDHSQVQTSLGEGHFCRVTGMCHTAKKNKNL